MKSNRERKVDYEDVNLNRQRDNRTRDREWNREEREGHRDGVAAIMERAAGKELGTRHTEEGGVEVTGLEDDEVLRKLYRHHVERKRPYSKGFAGALASVLNEEEER